MPEVSSGYLTAILPGVLGQLQRQQRSSLYFGNPVIWARDHLGIQLWEAQAEAAMKIVENKNTAIKAGHEVGKALALDTPILTPSGWTTMGEIRPGDTVYDENGNPCRVEGKSPVWMQDTYRVTFSDGAEIVTNDVHEWNTIDFVTAKAIRRSDGYTHDWRDYWKKSETRETVDIADTLGTKNGTSKNHIVPTARAISYATKNQPVAPYVLGAWLGDGTSVRPEMSIGEDGLYIVDEFAKLGVTLTKKAGKYRYSFAWQGFREKFEDLGILGNKAIPRRYMLGDEGQRLELLRGLMDTDGFHIHGSLSGMDLCNEPLARQVLALVRSLGWKATISEQDAKVSGRLVGKRWRMVFNTTESPFTRGSYKDQAWLAAKKSPSQSTMRTVTSVEKIETVPTACIWVGSDSHLYLAGEDLIPTHNSFLAGVMICWWIDTRWQLPGGCFVVSTAPSAKQINAIVWREVRKCHATSRKRHAEYQRRVKENLPLGDYAFADHQLPGYITADAHWRLFPDEGGIEVGYGAKPPKGQDDTMSGIHARYVLAVGDEAVGLTEALIGDLGNITSNATSRRFIIMNPTNPLSYAGKIFKDDNGTWALQTISVLDSPNFHGGGVCDCERHADQPFGLGLPIEVLETLVDQSYVDDMLRDYGEKHATFISRVLGEFAWDSGPMLISVEEMAVALDLEVSISDSRPVMGVDVSRSEKGDMNAVYLSHIGRVYDDKDNELGEGMKVRYLDSWNERNAMVTAEKINRMALENSAWVVYIDGSGLGGPIADRVRELSEGRYHCWDAIGGKPAPEDQRNRFYNSRAWWFSELRRKIATGYIDIDIEDKKLQEELLGIQTKFPNSGPQRLLIEGKDDMKKRGVGSPDYADSAMYSTIDPKENNPFMVANAHRFPIEQLPPRNYSSRRNARNSAYSSAFD